MFRKKVRTVLTIFGIAVGVFAVMIMGSIAEKLDVMVTGSEKIFGDNVYVYSDSWGIPITLEKILEIERIDGVERASAFISMSLDEDEDFSPADIFSPPPYIVASDLRGINVEPLPIAYRVGQGLDVGDEKNIVLGADASVQLDVSVGSSITVRGEEFEVVGIMDRTLTFRDSEVHMLLSDAQPIRHAQLPDIIQGQINVEDVADYIVAYPLEGINGNELAVRIRDSVDGVKAEGPEALEEVKGVFVVINSVIIGVALVSLIVGGLSIINTMTMSVTERVREIGIRKAVGASNSAIVRQFLTEASCIGILGGVVGIVTGILVVSFANSIFGETGTEIFLITGRLTVFALLFAFSVSLISGVYPAWYAARIKPVDAFRHE